MTSRRRHLVTDQTYPGLKRRLQQRHLFNYRIQLFFVYYRLPLLFCATQNCRVAIFLVRPVGLCSIAAVAHPWPPSVAKSLALVSAGVLPGTAIPYDQGSPVVGAAPSPLLTTPTASPGARPRWVKGQPPQQAPT